MLNVDRLLKFDTMDNIKNRTVHQTDFMEICTINDNVKEKR